MSVKIDPLYTMPDEKSNTDDWINFYRALKSKYGEKAATFAFVKRWGLRRGDVDITEIEKGTGLKLSKTFIEGVESKAEGVVDTMGGFFNTLGTGGKIVFYSSIGISILLVGGLVIRLITLSAADAGKVAGTAAKAYSGRV